MTKEIVFISDYFLKEVRGGAEFCNDALIGLLKNQYTVNPIKSSLVTPALISENTDSFFIVANFFQLSEESKTALSSCRYAIFEHDHKYIQSNNPVLWANFVAPESQIINKEFFRNAVTTICQSKMHAQILQKNLFLNNVTTFGGNIWTDQQLITLKKNMNTEKVHDHAVLRSNNKNKGMPAAVEFCRQNNLQFHFLEEQPFESFVQSLAKFKTLIFFPQWFESYSRLAIEAKILGCKIITNGLLGAASEDYFSQSGEELFATIKQNNKTIYKRWAALIDRNEVDFVDPITVPKISIIVPLYKGEKYIEGFLEDMENQTVFEQSELIIINADSPENEEAHILPFIERHPNVIYKKLDYVASVMETENMAIELSSGEFIAQACVDDRHSPQSIETLAKHLMLTPTVDLVYGDCLQTTLPNERFDKNSSNGALYEHSQQSFSRENMIKCLPGPMPMWRKNVHNKIGYFNPHLKRAGDWEFFLRMVEFDSLFKKVDIPIGLYYLNSEGLSTSSENFEEKVKEECQVFETYKHIFGEQNYNQFKTYFHQFD
jgi:glycosyltransferase involved in cell wall biosynthesis